MTSPRPVETWMPDGRHTEVLLDAARALLRSSDPDGVVAIVLDAVRSLGADVEEPSESGVGQLPLDLGLGVLRPRVPAGDPATLDRLGDVLPGLLEDAQVALSRTRQHAHLAVEAAVDPLTGLPNRRMAMRALGRLRPGDAVVMVDLDHFKQVNDRFGHQTGDEVLARFASTLRDHVRASDTLGRLGGEEFAILLPTHTVGEARRVVDRVRSAWRRERSHPITFSAGIAAVGAAGARDALARADQALYAAKRNGRDRIEVWPRG